MQLDLKPLELPGVFEIHPKIFEDERGVFVKIFQSSAFVKAGLAANFREAYFSVSRPGVIRGMHFQMPPHAHAKLVYCLSGSVLDVVLDLRRGGHYGRWVSVTLDAARRNMLYIPAGCAHGFRTMNQSATLAYQVTTEYEPAHDTGIRWDSFGFGWQCDHPNLSARDAGFRELSSFVSPF